MLLRFRFSGPLPLEAENFVVVGLSASAAGAICEADAALLPSCIELRFSLDFLYRDLDLSAEAVGVAGAAET